MKRTNMIICGILAVIISLTLTSCTSHSHTYTDEIVAATCESEGYTLHTCSECGESYKDNIVPATGHDYEDASCETAKTCKKCGKTVGEAVGHQYEYEETAATCCAAGSVKKTCLRCGDTETTAIPALGHSYTETVVNATCEEGGYTEYVCGRCGDSYRDNETEALGHQFTEATCTEPKTCSVCGHTEGESLGHDFVKGETVEPTTENEGYTVYKCSRCGAEEKRDMVSKLCAHEYEDTVVKATCTEDGYTVHKCKLCGESYTDSTVPASGHSWKNATCTEPKTCKVCGATKGDKLGHDWTAASCTECKVCSRCGEESGEVLGHSWTEATCTSPKTCTRCGKTEGVALGHKWKDATCTEVKTCTVCGTTSGKALGHDYADATYTTPRTCKRCGHTMGDVLKKVELPEEAKYDYPDWFYMLDIDKYCSISDSTVVKALDAYYYDYSSPDELPDLPTGCFYEYIDDNWGKMALVKYNVKEYIENITEFDDVVIGAAKKYRINAKLLQFLYEDRDNPSNPEGWNYSLDENSSYEDRLKVFTDWLEKVDYDKYLGLSNYIQTYKEQAAAKAYAESEVENGYVEVEGDEYKHYAFQEFKDMGFLVAYPKDLTEAVLSDWSSTYIDDEQCAELQKELEDAAKEALQSYIKTGHWDLTCLKDWGSTDLAGNTYVIHYVGAYFTKAELPDGVSTVEEINDFVADYLLSDETLTSRLHYITDYRFGSGDLAYGFSPASRFYIYVEDGYVYIEYISIRTEGLIKEDINNSNPGRIKQENIYLEEVYPNIVYKG